jgi:chloramphenicol-sensitive protein RarD
MTRWQLAAVILASIGVLMITVQYGRVPWISLFLAFSFAAYGLVKKIIRVDSITGLTMETLVIMPAALFYIITLEKNAVGALGSAELPTVLFLAGTGVITAVPLIFYARGIEKTTFSMMGFLQYIAPSISLVLGIFIFKEHFSFLHLVSFCFIWAALLVFTLDSVGIIRDPFLIRAGKL